MSEDICCPKFNPGPWDGQTLTWEKKKFIKDRVRTIAHMPIGFGKVMQRLATAAGDSVSKDWMALSDHTSSWNMDLFLAVDDEVPGAENVMLSGKFLSKVYEGDFRQTGDWMKDFFAYAEKEGKKIGKTYMWYTTCPKCVKKYGKNYVVVIGEITK